MTTRKQQTSLRDLAQHLGLSTSTVSRALADHRDISAATKARVRQAAQELHYRPNQLAAALRRGHSQTLGVIVPHIEGYFFPAVMNGIEKVAPREGFNVIICQSNENLRREQRNIDALLAAQVEGILMSVSAATHPKVAHFEQVRRQGTPLVFFDRVPDLPDSMAVSLDNFQGAFQAVRHLIEQGCTRIGHRACPLHLNTSRNRFLGYRAALEAHGLLFDETSVYSLPALTHDGGRLAMQHLLPGARPQRRVRRLRHSVGGGAGSAARERLAGAPRYCPGLLQQRALHGHDSAPPDSGGPARRADGRNCRAPVPAIAQARPRLCPTPPRAQARADYSRLVAAQFPRPARTAATIFALTIAIVG